MCWRERECRLKWVLEWVGEWFGIYSQIRKQIFTSTTTSANCPHFPSQPTPPLLQFSHFLLEISRFYRARLRLGLLYSLHSFVAISLIRVVRCVFNYVQTFRIDARHAQQPRHELFMRPKQKPLLICITAFNSLWIFMCTKREWCTIEGYPAGDLLTLSTRFLSQLSTSANTLSGSSSGGSYSTLINI